MAEANSIVLPCRVKDLTGKPFGRLTVVRYNGSKDGNAQWLCRCECGDESSVAASELTRTARPSTKSCGCFQREKARNRVTTHGRTLTTEYRSWKGMIQRCYNSSDSNWHRYGARGIIVCDRWRESFKAFFEDMGNKPSPEHSIERKENNGNYEPGNCKWATQKEQNRNKRTTVLLTFDGRTQCVAAWAEELNMAVTTLWNRLKRGWPTERALTAPRPRRPPRCTPLQS